MGVTFNPYENNPPHDEYTALRLLNDDCDTQLEEEIRDTATGAKLFENSEDFIRNASFLVDDFLGGTFGFTDDKGNNLTVKIDPDLLLAKLDEALATPDETALGEFYRVHQIPAEYTADH